MTDQEAAQAFVADPYEFLLANWVSIGSGGSTPSGIQSFTISQVTPGVQRDPNTRAPMGITGVAKQTIVVDKSGNRFEVVKKRPKWQIRLKKSGFAGAEFQGYYLAMKNLGDTQGTYFSLSLDGGSDVMLTSMLNGCTFGFGPQPRGSCCIVSHIRPSDTGRGGSQRQMDQLSTKALEGTGGVGGLVQQGTGYTGQATVVGKRKDGQWHFYCQRQDEQDTITQVYEVPGSTT